MHNKEYCTINHLQESLQRKLHHHLERILMIGIMRVYITKLIWRKLCGIRLEINFSIFIRFEPLIISILR